MLHYLCLEKANYCRIQVLEQVNLYVFVKLLLLEAIFNSSRIDKINAMDVFESEGDFDVHAARDPDKL